MNIIEAMRDPELFAPWFKKDAGEWAAWEAFLAALFALPMDAEAQAIYRACTRRQTAPSAPFTEAWMVVGRRGGKSFISALTAVYLACFRDYREHLAPGERATVAVLAADRKQARVIMRYIAGLLEGVPMLAALIERQNGEEIELSNRVNIEVVTASFRASRGYTYAAVICDEIAFWRSDESANPDTEILAALRPGMASIPGALLIGLSSPYARRGELWEAYKRHHGKDDSQILVWQADTRRMNPTISQGIIEYAYARDPARASAEYGAQFRTDVEAFISREILKQAVGDYVSRPPVEGVKYFGFVDPSGGSSDSMTLGIAHKEQEQLIVDCLLERKPPFSPESVTAEFSATLKQYRIDTVTGDRYAGEWPREKFREHGIEYRTAGKTRSELYLELLPALTSARVTMPQNDRVFGQLINLERRTSRAGKDTIDHPRGGHDDIANALAGAVAEASRPVVDESECIALPISVGGGSNPFADGPYRPY